MAECIEKERVVEWFRPYGHEDDGIPYDVLVADIRDMPAADVAPVVRCKDCKHRYSDSWCEYVDDDDNFYCARGERKEGADNG